MRKTCLDMVYELAKEDERIFFVGSDLGAGTLDRFREEIPERFFMEGIGEANVVGMAAGLALEGKVVYVNTIASFLTRRAFEQIVIDLCHHNLKVRLIGNGGGMVYAPLGPTHMVVEDMAIMRALPNMAVVAPSDADEMRRLMPLTVDYPGPLYIRLAKGYDPIVSRGDRGFAIGDGILAREGDGALIVTTGITLKIALEAADLLGGRGVDAGVLHLHTLKPLDKGLLLERIGRAPVVVTVEEHSVVGGLGSAVAEVLAEGDFDSPKKFRRMGLPDMFPDAYGSQAELMDRFSITAGKIAELVEEMK